MVVVPALAEGQEGDQDVVAARVGRRVALPSPKVAGRVHQKGRVVRQHAAHEEAPDQAAPAADEEAQPGQDEGRQSMIPVEPTQFGVAAQVLYQPPVRCAGGRGQDPADVGPPKAVADGGVQVLGRVRGAVVVPMLRRPPQRPLLGCATPQPGQHELERPARLVRAVGEVTVVAGSHADDLEEVASHAESQGKHVRAGEEHRQASDVQQDEYSRSEPSAPLGAGLPLPKLDQA